MPRFRNRGMALRLVHRIKHVVDGQGGIAAAGTSSTNVIQTVDVPILANVTEVETGSKVNGIYIHLEAVRVGTASGVVANVYMSIMKSPGGSIAVIAGNVVGADVDKRYVIHQEMIMLQQVDNSNPRTVFNGVVVIPRGYRRFGPNDKLIISIFTPGVAINFCWQAHYKEFR